MSDRPLPTATERTETLRKALGALLADGQAHSVRELSQAVGVTEREVLAHLEHLDRSVRQRGAHLTVTPARCVGCGFRFDERSRLNKPSRCPRCKATRITQPRFSIDGIDGVDGVDGA